MATKGVARPYDAGADRREIILAAAIEHFSRFGYTNSRLSKIASQAGVTDAGLAGGSRVEVNQVRTCRLSAFVVDRAVEPASSGDAIDSIEVTQDPEEFVLPRVGQTRHRRGAPDASWVEPDDVEVPEHVVGGLCGPFEGGIGAETAWTPVVYQQGTCPRRLIAGMNSEQEHRQLVTVRLRVVDRHLLCSAAEVECSDPVGRYLVCAGIEILGAWLPIDRCCCRHRDRGS